VNRPGYELAGIIDEFLPEILTKRFLTSHQLSTLLCINAKGKCPIPKLYSNKGPHLFGMILNPT